MVYFKLLFKNHISNLNCSHSIQFYFLQIQTRTNFYLSHLVDPFQGQCLQGFFVVQKSKVEGNQRKTIERSITQVYACFTFYVRQYFRAL